MRSRKTTRAAPAPGPRDRGEPRARHRRRRRRRQRAPDERLPSGRLRGPATCPTTRWSPASRTPTPRWTSAPVARAPERAGRGDGPAQPERDRRLLQRLLRRLQRDGADGAPLATGPIWIGYYRSIDGGASFVSSLVPGYPGDTSPYARARSCARRARVTRCWPGTATAPVRGHRDLRGPGGTPKGFGDQGVATFENPAGPERRTTTRDGLEFKRTVVVAKGSSAPPARQVPRQDGDRGRPHRRRLRRQRLLRLLALHRLPAEQHLLHPLDEPRRELLQAGAAVREHEERPGRRIAVTRNGNVYVTWNAERGPTDADEAVEYVKSTDCGKTFSVRTLVTYTTYEAQDVGAHPPPAQAQPTTRRRPRREAAGRSPRSATSTPRASPATRSSAVRPRPARPRTSARRTRTSTSSTTRACPAAGGDGDDVRLDRARDRQPVAIYFVARRRDGRRRRRRSGSTRRRRATSCSPTSPSRAAHCTRCGGTRATTPTTRTRPVGNAPSGDASRRWTRTRRRRPTAARLDAGRRA